MRILKERTLFSSLIGLLGKDHSRRYKGEEGKETADFERLLKKNWNYSADRNFIESIKLVHWFMSGDPSKFLGTSHRDEVSAEGYLPAEPMISNFTSTQVGVLLDGYVTFAMRSGGGTGFFGGDATPEKWKSSGMVKRAQAGKANFKHKLILNKDSRFRDKGAYNEFIVDNWKPTALIAKGGINNPFYKELYNYSVENNLPVIDENGDQVELQDPAEFSAGKKISTGFGRLARGALPEGEKMKMKITTARLKQIIKEEIDSSLEDLEARMAAMDTRRDDDTKKVKHRGARDELNEIARTLQQMFDLSNAVAQKKSEHFQNTTVYGLSIREQPALKELADITREYAKHVKDAEAEPMSEGRGSEYSENLRYTNDRVDHIIKKVNELSDEIVHGSTRGGPYQRMPVDMYIDGFDNYDEPRKVLRDQAEKLRFAIKYGLDHPVPQAIRDRLSNEVKSGFLSKMRGIKD